MGIDCKRDDPWVIKDEVGTFYCLLVGGFKHGDIASCRGTFCPHLCFPKPPPTPPLLRYWNDSVEAVANVHTYILTPYRHTISNLELYTYIYDKLLIECDIEEKKGKGLLNNYYMDALAKSWIKLVTQVKSGEV